MANSNKNAATQNKNAFLPDNYEPPKGGGGDNYMKFVDGTTRFRCISKPIMGTLAWDMENKPKRFRLGEKTDGTWKDKPKHFWALVAWNYDLQRPQVLEITQQTVIAAITELNNDSDWGAPWNYDLKVVRKGQKLETEYSVNPSPKKKISQEIRDAVSDWEINLELLFDDADPFVSIPDSVVQMDNEIDDTDDEQGDDDLPFN
tara:strand:- start:5369 stop:5977 length:609 start_codon:yes stop_codon:yes gene_type:complete